jgi:hypothetical protein
MYVSNQLLRVHRDEWLRHAETRRLIKQAAASSDASGRSPQRRRIRRPALRFGRPPRHA